MNPTVFVMMSGGVDSSVAVAILVEKGYNVVGVFMKCWSIEQLESLGANKELYGCFWEEDSKDASLVAGKLGIPFYVWDFEQEYKKRVVDYMLSEYDKGRTPNPDVMCNSTIKFGIFFERAMQLGADFVSTGHYARSMNHGLFGNLFRGIGRGKDEQKDQSYFLWGVESQRISQTLFPIGEFESKAVVRSIAEKKGLITAHKKDSQGLCFIGETPLRDLLMQTLGTKEGDIVNEKGEKLGIHQGAHLYTIGQRQKLGLSGGPWFVFDIDVKSNVVMVTHSSNEHYLYSQEMTITSLNLFVTEDVLWRLSEEGLLSGQIRYRQQAETCSIKFLTYDKAVVIFSSNVRAPAKGQSVVLYCGDFLVGGGIINEISR